MKYYLFAGSYYYPYGGIDDFIGAYETIDSAKQAFLEKASIGYLRNDSGFDEANIITAWAHIANSEMKKVADGEYSAETNVASWGDIV